MIKKIVLPMSKNSTPSATHQISKTPMPRASVNKLIMSYATALKVIKSKTIGNFDVFLN
jgi:hypothetical protein